MPRRRYRRRRFRRKGRSVKAVAYRALKLAKKANKLPELKYNELNPTPTTGTAITGGWTTALDTLAAGTDNNTRIGNVVKPTSVRIKPDWAKILTDANGGNFRIVVFRWVSEAPAQGFGQATQVLQSADIYSFKSQNLRFQSQILYDQLFLDKEITSGRKNLPTEIKIPLKNKIAYNDADSASNRGGIYLLYIGDQTSTTLTAEFYTRMYFRDN